MARVEEEIRFTMLRGRDFFYPQTAGGNFKMRRKIIYIFVFFIAVAIRLLVNFKYDLIPGINGGYYPLQVRSILTNGNLGFSDMPLHFYFNAFVVKVISFFVKADINSVIILVLKTVDSIFLPLLLIPFYELSKK